MSSEVRSRGLVGDGWMRMMRCPGWQHNRRACTWLAARVVMTTTWLYVNRSQWDLNTMIWPDSMLPGRETERPTSRPRPVSHARSVGGREVQETQIDRGVEIVLDQTVRQRYRAQRDEVLMPTGRANVIASKNGPRKDTTTLQST